MKERHVVTGAFGYSGRYISERLLASGYEVRTLTNSMARESPLAGKIEAFPLSFDDSLALTKALEGTTVLYNTYWVRFNHKRFKHLAAVENTKRLFAAARSAGVQRVVHVSITNPSLDSDLEYFRGKAELERELRASELSFGILRPTVLFGKEDILINNIAWILRKFPLFGLFGDGEYKLQPIYVNDLAALALEQGKSRKNAVVDAIGPETFTFRELVELIGQNIGVTRKLISIPPGVGYFAGWIIGKCVGDVVITRPEIEGLMRGLLYVDSSPAGKTPLSDWLRENVDQLGRSYASEIGRRKDRRMSYWRS